MSRIYHSWAWIFTSKNVTFCFAQQCSAIPDVWLAILVFGFGFFTNRQPIGETLRGPSAYVRRTPKPIVCGFCGAAHLSQDHSRLATMYYFSQSFNYTYVFFLDIISTSYELCSHPWSHVVIGMWHKYPNPHCSHVLSVDVLDRSVDPETGVVRTERILGCKQKAPSWVLKVHN